MYHISLKTAPSLAAKILNKEVLVFLALLFLSMALWMVTVLKEHDSMEFRFAIKLVGAPENVVLLSDDVDTLTVVVSDTRWMLLDYLGYKDTERAKLEVNFARYRQRQNNEVVITSAELHKIFRQYFGKSTSISFKRDKLVFLFDIGEQMRLPIRFKGRVNSKDQVEIKLASDSVDVFASKSLKLTLSEVKTVADSIEVNDTIQHFFPFQKIYGVSYKQKGVNVTITPVVYVEKTMNIPVQCINEPADKKLKLFPPRVALVFLIDMKMVSIVQEDMFSVVADYNTVAGMTEPKCKFELLKYPTFVKNVKMSTDESDYLIVER